MWLESISISSTLYINICSYQNGWVWYLVDVRWQVQFSPTMYFMSLYLDIKCCKKQPIVALSSIEAEYRGAAITTCEAIWIKRLLRNLRVEVANPKTIFCDNLNNIQLAKNLVFHARTKHIEVHYHFESDRVLSSESIIAIHSDGSIDGRHLHQASSNSLRIPSSTLGRSISRRITTLCAIMFSLVKVELQYIPTDWQMDEIFTKPLGLDKFRQFSGMLGLRC